ncbi:hypothetical protein [Capnocytophaga sp. G2]|uniref:hypothetical protein n=1 Tax=Capnocytophaga sp. G2 TaxID=3110695 RepID=UPI002B46B53E|nr:hypothetical protein [Capnocytophaga sp. G2]MEB3005727.1 hypothetical protein [Capnocytophaga sp. G2]
MKIGDQVKISRYTTDPAGQQGNIGTVIGVYDEGEMTTVVRVVFATDKGEKFSALYDIDCLIPVSEDDLED